MTDDGTRISFRYLSEPDMIAAGVTDMAACVDAMEETLRLVDAGDYRMGGPEGNSHGSMVTFPAASEHDGMPLDGPHRRMMAMPAYLGGSFQTAGCKWYGSNLANRERGLPRSILMFTLSDKDTGAPLAFMSANLLSAYRTGAIPGVGARHLAREDARSVGIVAPGVMNRTTLEAFAAVRPGLDTLTIAGRSRAGVDSFVDWVREALPQFTSVTVVDGVEAAVRDSDLVTIAPTTPTGSHNYVRIEREWIKPGALVSLPADIMLDEGLLHGARHVADFRGLYEAWSEEVPHPAHEHIGLHGMYLLDRIREGAVAPERLENLPSIMSGAAPGRTDDDEIFLYSVGGMPVEDVAWGTVVYRNAVARDIGVELPLWDAPALV
ncbi:tyramine oxidase subunit B [Schumannella luteola]|uniref:Ornithine cyclodeaminase n=1 Tax=Schumannella luteola TaxID=472059 RepID=A0A852YMS6_9MICO|nr:tyramine oxidase subunit B [Schumannella luteola]NYH00479.1 ornithine cyclodeaminase [Schumannella luteola]TPX06262.1 ornithine cyclodeaminase [Schumannella luteola]